MRTTALLGRRPVRCAGLAVLLALGAVGLAVAQTDYVVGPGDLLKVSVADSPELGRDVRVSQSGEISYPFLGELRVGGRTPTAIGVMIGAQLQEKGIARRPQVTVLVTEYRSQLIAVLGQVNKPGQYPLQVMSHLTDLVAAAGGLDNAAAADEATLLHADGSKRAVDLKALFAGDSSQNAQMQAGDTIFVPKAPQFYIYGEVQRPGVYKLERNITVSQAISAGGGLTPRGSERRVVVKRRDAKGKEQVIDVRGSDPLQPNDTLMVKESLF